MDNKNQKDLQSRREFFKSAAKAAMPVLGIAFISSLPSVMAASSRICEACTGICTGCQGGCQSTCFGCDSTCTGNCVASSK